MVQIYLGNPEGSGAAILSEDDRRTVESSLLDGRDEIDESIKDFKAAVHETDNEDLKAGTKGLFESYLGVRDGCLEREKAALGEDTGDPSETAGNTQAAK